MAKKGGLKGTYKTKAAANRRRYSHIGQGSPITRSVKKACALVQSGAKKGKLKKGCRLTKSGARCDELVRLPEKAYDRKRKAWVDCG